MHRVARVCRGGNLHRDRRVGQAHVAPARLILHRHAIVLDRHHARRTLLAVVPVEVLHLLAQMQVASGLHDAPRIGKQLLDDPTELVQLGAGGHRQVLQSQVQAHGHPHDCGGCTTVRRGRWVGNSPAAAEAASFARRLCRSRCKSTTLPRLSSTCGCTGDDGRRGKYALNQVLFSRR